MKVFLILKMEVKMLKRSILLAMLIVSIVTFSSPARSELLYLDQGVVYETMGDQYWFHDLSFFINKNYDEQIESVSDLGGNWRMANEEDIDNLRAYDSMEIGKVFIPSYMVINLYNGTVSNGWRGRSNYIFLEDPVNGIYHAGLNIWKENETWHNKVILGFHTDSANEFLGAWVVTDTCPLTSLELLDLLYKTTEESKILIKIKKSYLKVLNQITDFNQKDRTCSALNKIEILSSKIQEDIDNSRIDNQTGTYLITILNILKNTLSTAV